MNSITLDDYYLQHIVTSLIFFFVLIAIRFLLVKQVSHLKISPAETKRSIIVKINNIFIIIIFLSFITIWSDEIKTMAISFVAIAAAIAIATKEFILCFIGGLYKWLSKPFSVGDRIEVSTFRGEVVDFKFLSTTLIEIGPGKEHSQYTGRVLVIPNSIYLTSTIAKESHTESFTLHSFIVPISNNEDWSTSERNLLIASKEACDSYFEEAKNFYASEKHFFVLGPVNIEPRVQLSIVNPNQINLIVRLPCPSLQTNQIQQNIIRYYLELQSFSKKNPIQTERPGVTVT
ncbi:mechanosensitive ion channel [Silvanigrella paludirubra]|uniref:Mechanosensitive ion channel n=1 Tax=Silvanigrella paludirubra TaxID=2499159 RepID=A0A6N6VPW7_9BACT|nr:mechanosensitive ion channel family protein [Silvanigrella paludirubra]KAB8036483.1 mechanosensitive ion channel [Silvanigrella paludirubra]